MHKTQYQIAQGSQHKTIKLPEEVGSTLQDKTIGKVFLNTNSIAQENRPVTILLSTLPERFMLQ